MVPFALPDGSKGVSPPASLRFARALGEPLLGHGHAEEDCGKFTRGILYRVPAQARRPAARSTHMGRQTAVAPERRSLENAGSAPVPG